MDTIEIILNKEELLILKKREYFRNYRENNRGKINEISRNFYHNKIDNDPLYRLIINQRTTKNKHKILIESGLPIRSVGRSLKIF